METETIAKTETVTTYFRCGHEGAATLTYTTPFERREQLTQAWGDAKVSLCPRCQQTQSQRQQASQRGGSAMPARYRGECGDCGDTIHVGDLIVWSREQGARHLNCGDIRSPMAFSEN